MHNFQDKLQIWEATRGEKLLNKIWFNFKIILQIKTINDAQSFDKYITLFMATLKSKDDLDDTWISKCEHQFHI